MVHRGRHDCRWILTALLMTISNPVFAQPKPEYAPSATHTFPAGGRRGTTVPLRVGAECLPPGAEFHVFGDGVTGSELLGERVDVAGERSAPRKPTEIPATYPKEWASEITIADDAPLGFVWWRLSCAQGGTRPRPFVIGDLPEFIEQESNSKPEHAETVSVPVTLNGQINGERDVDYYRFAAQAGSTVSCEVVASRLGSRLDPVVDLLDLDGHPVPVDHVTIGGDTVLIVRSEQSTEYLLRIANLTHHGDPGYVYRINLVARPWLAAAYPDGGEAGVESDMELLIATGGGALETVHRTLRFPESAPDGPFVFEDRESLANSLPLRVDERPHVTEQEPNPAVDQATRVTVPVTVHGRFLDPTDRDVFSFHAGRDERLAFLCEAAPRGAGALPVIVLTAADGATLLRGDCATAPDGRCRLEWTVPADGDYFVQLRDLRFGAQGGADFLYRLSIWRAAPGFELRVATDALNLMPGQEAELEVTATRSGGFTGPINLVFDGLPEGLAATNLQIAENASSTKVKLATADGYASQGFVARLLGRATVGNNPLERPVQCASAMDTGVATEPGRLFVTVCHKPQFRLFCEEAYLYAHRGSVFPYRMQVERLNDFDGEITLQIGDRQNRDLDGIEMFEVTLPPSQSEIDLPIYLPETMAINVQSQSQLYSQGWAQFVDARGRRQGVLVLSEKRNMLRTLPPVVKLNAVDEKLTGRAGDEVTCRLRLDRTSNFPGPMTLTLIAPAGPELVEMDETTIAAGQSEIEVLLRLRQAAPNAGPVTLLFRASGKLDERVAVLTEAAVQLHMQ